jgi:type I restriction enzyme R subunit
MIAAIGDGKTSADLKAALEGKQARIIVTTLQKFPVVAQTATALSGSRFAVIVDEAHSSQTGEAVKDLKAVLAGASGDQALQLAADVDAQAEDATPDTEDLLLASARARGAQANLSFFAFTATPKAKTLERFGEKVVDAAGEERFVPFHLYSMRQAIAEGFILDVLANYTTYATYYRLANGLGSEDEELPKGKAMAALARFVSLHPTNLAQKAEIIIEHFRAHTANKIGGQAKAMVVTRSRLHALRYYHALQAYVTQKGYDKGAGKIGVLVAFSGSLTDPDTPNVTYTEAMLNGFGEKELPKRFASDDYQVLVVAEKYQTGFDQPLLHTMYVDKPLAGVKAVQTLSRVNRVHPGKTDTFVLDFANTAEDIQAAFEPYYAQTVAAPTDPNVLYNLQRRLLDAGLIHPDEMAAGVEAVLRGGAAGAARLNAATDPAIDRYLALEDDAQEEFRSALTSYVRAYAFLGQIIPWQDTDLEALYFYGKYLATRLPAPDTGGTIDLDGSVVLTHLRTDLKAEQENLSLAGQDGAQEPLAVLVGEGRGKQFEELLEPLSALIETLNERFGMDLDEADRVWFEQQKTHMENDTAVRVVALNNDFEQFKVWLAPKIQDAVIDRQDANLELFQSYFNKPEFADLMTQWLTETLYGDIRSSG